MMKRILLSTLFAVASFNASADVPGGAGCGWGNMLFRGQYGAATHMVVATASDTSDNNTLSMTTSTNGCHTNSALSHDSKSLLMPGNTMGELSEDMAKDNDEALTTYTVVLGVQPQDHEHFATVIHEHFPEIFNKSDATAANVYANVQTILRQDARLAKYAGRA